MLNWFSDPQHKNHTRHHSVLHVNDLSAYNRFCQMWENYYDDVIFKPIAINAHHEPATRSDESAHLANAIRANEVLIF